MDQPCPPDTSMALSGLTLSGMTLPVPVTPSQSPRARLAQPPRASPAQRRWLQVGSLTRWLWAVGAKASLVGLLLLLQTISRLTVAPMVWLLPLALPPFLNPTPESRNSHPVWGASLWRLSGVNGPGADSGAQAVIRQKRWCQGGIQGPAVRCRVERAAASGA